jgi:hypothetical protein
MASGFAIAAFPLQILLGDVAFEHWPVRLPNGEIRYLSSQRGGATAMQLACTEPTIPPLEEKWLRLRKR